MSQASHPRYISRVELLETMGKAAAVTVVAPSFLERVCGGGGDDAAGGRAPLAVNAGPDRVVMEVRPRGS